MRDDLRKKCTTLQSDNTYIASFRTQCYAVWCKNIIVLLENNEKCRNIACHFEGNFASFQEALGAPICIYYTYG